MNNDKHIDSVDASKVLAEYALLSSGKNGNFGEKENKAADVDQNGKTDSVDASKILAYYAYASANRENAVSLSEFLAK